MQLERPLPDSVDKPFKCETRKNYGLWIATGLGMTGIVTISIAMPFILPAMRKHCLPYVPATDIQLSNLGKSLKKHCKIGESFLDIGSGDGRICRLAASQKLFTQVHGVELNPILVYYCRLYNLFSNDSVGCRFYHADLWKFSLGKYDSICIFGVDTMMQPLAEYLIRQNKKPQTIFACRFPLKNLHQIDEIGTGIDTVWVYKLKV